MAAHDFPHWWFGRVWTLHQLVTITSVKYDTLFRWMQTLQTIGFEFGEKGGREWAFNAHELYVLRVLAAFHLADIPISLDHIRTVALFAYGDDGKPRHPQGKLAWATPDAEVSVDAPLIFQAIVVATNPDNLEGAADRARTENP